MTVLFLSLIALAAVAALAGFLLNKRVENGDAPENPDVAGSNDTVAPGTANNAGTAARRAARADGCCGQHELCEKESLLAAVSKSIEYYNDEELDRFRGHAAEGYTEAEVEEFQEVLFTMRSDEVAGWLRSLQLRGVQLPDELKDDVLMIVGERREAGHA